MLPTNRCRFQYPFCVLSRTQLKDVATEELLNENTKGSTETEPTSKSTLEKYV